MLKADQGWLDLTRDCSACHNVSCTINGASLHIFQSITNICKMSTFLMTAVDVALISRNPPCLLSGSSKMVPSHIELRSAFKVEVGKTLSDIVYICFGLAPKAPFHSLVHIATTCTAVVKNRKSFFYESSWSFNENTA